MKKLFLLLSAQYCISCFAQQQRFDVLTYTLPKGWQQKEVKGGKQLIITDSKTGDYAIALLVKAIASTAPASEIFDQYWNSLVKTTVTVSGEPTLQPAVNGNGWEIVSGTAGYTDGANTGTVTLLSACGGGQAAAVVIMSNATRYQNDLAALINSLALAKTKSTTNTGNAPALSISGLWADYVVEKNASRQYTTGYLRKEYRFNTNGTYTFRKKNFLTKAADIHFVSETGTYSIKGNQLTLTPKQGVTQFWKKAKSLKNNEWGSFTKSAKHPLETITYTVELIEDPNYSNTIVLKAGKPTTRDGGQFNAPGDPYTFNYAFRKTESLIDNPPGF